jgi:hypothetical protein
MSKRTNPKATPCIALLALITGFLFPSLLKAAEVEILLDTTLDEEGLMFATGSQTKFNVNVNGRTFGQQNAVTTFNGWQYATYYDAERRVVLARRKLPDGEWDHIRFEDYRIEGNDAHNIASVGICEGDGTIHLAFDLHAHDLNYRVSELGVATSPESVEWSADLFGPVTDQLGSVGKLTRVTYPRFFRAPNGNLMLYYRFGGSGNGQGVIQEYDASKHDWTPGLGAFISSQGVYNGVLSTNSTSRNPYNNGIYYAGDTIHLSWNWRESAGGAAYNHDLAYAYSDDNGRTWYNQHGVKIGETGKTLIDVDSEDLLVAEIPQDEGMINSYTMYTYPDGRSHVIMHRNRPSYTHYFSDASGDWHAQALSIGGSRPEIVGDSAGNLYLVHISGSNLAIAKGTPKDAEIGYDWEIVYKRDGVAEAGEGLLDRNRWEFDRVLSVFGQEAPGEQLDYGSGTPIDGMPSPVYVIDFKVTDEDPPVIISNNKVSITTAAGNGGDVFIKPGKENNQGAIEVKNAANANGPGVTTKSYLKFDISSVADRLDEVASAGLHLTTSFNHIGGSSGDPAATTVYVYGLKDESLDDWDELQVVWENAPANDVTSNEWSEGSVVALGSINVPANPEPDPVGYTSEALVDFIAADTNGIVTLLLRREDSNGSHNMRFASKEVAADAGEPTWAPTLSLELVPPEPVTFEGLVGAVTVGGNQYSSSWFGMFETASDGWILHHEQGWLFTDLVESSDSMWLYSSILDGWIWTSEDFYPVYYDYAGARWVYFFSQAEIGTYLYDYATGEWTILGGPYVPVVPDAQYTIVSMPVAPFVDGVAGEGEWADAINYPLTYDALISNGTGTSDLDIKAGSPQPEALRAEAQAFVGATAKGLYVGFDVTDPDINDNPGFGVAGNGFDGVQIGVDVNPDPTDRVSSLLVDINPAVTPDDTTNVYARWAIDGYMPAWGMQASTTAHEGGYFVEVFIPWAFATSFGVDNPLAVNSELKLTMIVLDFDENGTRRELLWDAGEGALSIGNPATWPDAVITEELMKVDNSYSIPKVSAAPTIDGEIDLVEWQHAAYNEASYDNWVLRSNGTSRLESQSGAPAPDAQRASGGIYMAATDEAIYWAAQIVDPDITITNEFGTASNAMDGVQMLITLDPEPTNRDTAILWDFTAATMVGGELTGPANIFARFALSGYDESWGVEAAGSFTEDGYIIEVKMPWQFLRDLGVDNPLGDQDVFRLSWIVVDKLDADTTNDLITDTGSGNFAVGDPSIWSKAVLDD